MIKKDKFNIETFIDDFFYLQIDYAGRRILPLEEKKKIKKNDEKKKKKIKTTKTTKRRRRR